MPRIAYRGMAAWKGIAFSFLLSLAVCSCFRLGLPPGFDKSGSQARASFPPGISAVAQYSVLSWYLKEEEDKLPEVLRKEVEASCKEAGHQIFRSWAQSLATKHSPLLRLDQGIPVLNANVFSQNLGIDAGLGLIADLRVTMQSPAQVEIPLKEVLAPQIWRKTPRGMRDHFEDWCKDCKTIQIPDPGMFDRQAFQQELEWLEQTLRFKKDIIAFLDAYDNEKKHTEADLKNLLNRMSALQETLPADLSFQRLGDDRTLPRFREVASKLPYTILSTGISFANEQIAEEKARLKEIHRNFDSASLAFLDKMEAGISSLLSIARNDRRFVQALQTVNERIVALVADSAEMRRLAWMEEIQELVEQREYWKASQCYVKDLSFLRNKAGSALEAYHHYTVSGSVSETFAAKIERSMNVQYLGFLPTAMKEILPKAQEAVVITDNPGLALAYCELFTQMYLAVSGLPVSDSLKASMADLEKIRKQSLEALYTRKLKRAVSIGDFTSTAPGIGLTFSRDLANELSNALKSLGMSTLVFLSENGDSNSNWGYSAYGGVVANFDGNETTERLVTRVVSRHEEGRRHPNPDYKPEAGRDAPKSQTSPQVYEQDTLRQLIHVKELERIAHVRVFCNFRGPGFTRLVEVNEFYSKMFVQEESHPFHDIEKTTVRYYDMSGLKAAEPEPILQYDRVWTPGEMLDWARRDSVHLASLMILKEIVGFPVYLSEQAKASAKAGNAKESAEIWGECHALLMNQDMTTSVLSQLKTEKTIVAKAYPDCLESLRKQRKQLAEIKQSCLPAMLEQVSLYFVEATRKNTVQK